MTPEQVALITLVTTTLASIFTILIQQLIAYLVTKRKTGAEVNQIEVGTDLVAAELIEKYQGMNINSVNQRIEIEKQLSAEREAHIAEKNELLKQVDGLRQDVEELKDKFEQEKKDNEQWRDWARRLSLQVQSLGFIPVPFDVEEAKRKGYSMGDMGNYRPHEEQK